MSPLPIWGLIRDAFLFMERPRVVVGKEIGMLKGLGFHAKAFECCLLRDGKFKRH